MHVDASSLKALGHSIVKSRIGRETNVLLFNEIDPLRSFDFQVLQGAYDFARFSSLYPHFLAIPEAKNTFF